MVEISIGDLACKIINMIDSYQRISCEDKRVRPINSEVKRLLGSSAKLRILSGRGPEYNFERGRTETLAWFRAEKHVDKFRPGDYTI